MQLQSSTEHTIPSRGPAPEFWKDLQSDADLIRCQLQRRAARTANPNERRGLEKLADCARILAEVLTPSGGGLRRA